MMSYYLAKQLECSFEEALVSVTEALKVEGFGVLTEIDVQATLKEKLDVDFRPYRILGACNPPFAYRALQAERNVGLLLPCNVIVQEVSPELTEIAVIDPVASMGAVENAELAQIAQDVQGKLERVIQSL
jgi:uncharacterized protein (DUF302 family)